MALTQLKSSALNKPSDALVRGFVDDILFGFFDKLHPLYHNTRVFAAINACLEMHRTLTEQRLAKQLPVLVRDQPDAEFLYAVLLVARLSGGWPLLQVPAQQKVIELLQKGNGSEVVKVLSSLSRIEALKPEIDARIARLNTQELGDAIALYGLRDGGKRRALELLSQSFSWSAVNDVVERTVLPLFDCFGRGDIEQILRFQSETGADIRHSGGLAKIVERTRHAALFAPDELNALLKAHGADYLVTQG